MVNQYTALHSQYSQMEAQYRQALDDALSSQATEDDKNLAEQLSALTTHCKNCELKISDLTSDVEAVRQEKARALDELTSALSELSGTNDALLQIQSDAKSYEAAQTQLDGMKSRVAELERIVESSEEAKSQEQKAKETVLHELEKVNETLSRSQQAANNDAAVVSSLNKEIATLKDKLFNAEEQIQQLPVHEPIIASHSTPTANALPNTMAELYDSTQYADSELSHDVSLLREEFNTLQIQYNKDTSALRMELESERKNVESLRTEMHESLNSSAQSTDASSIANLTEVVSALQAKNDQLNSEKQELNRQLVEQEKLCQKLHDRVGVSESLSESIQESYAKQLAAAQRQRDEILQQLEEATKVNEQVTHLVAERNMLHRDRSDAKDELRDRDDLEVELLKMKTQLESLAHSHQKMSDNLDEKDKKGLELSRRNSVLETAVQQMETKLKQSELAFVSEREVAVAKQTEVDDANKKKLALESRLAEERTLQRNRLTAELQQTKTASEKNTVIQIRQMRMDIEQKYNEAIAKLKLELAEESKRKQERLRSHSSQLKEIEIRHEKQVQFATPS